MYLTPKPLDAKFRTMVINGYHASKNLLVDRFQFFANIFENQEIENVDWSILTPQHMVLIQVAHGDFTLTNIEEPELLRLIEASTYLVTSEAFTNYLISKLTFSLDLNYYSKDIVRMAKYLGNEKYLATMPLEQYQRLAPVLSKVTSTLLAHKHNIDNIIYDTKEHFDPKSVKMNSCGILKPFCIDSKVILVSILVNKFLTEDCDIYSIAIPVTDVFDNDGTQMLKIQKWLNPGVISNFTLDPKLINTTSITEYNVSDLGYELPYQYGKCLL